MLSECIDQLDKWHKLMEHAAISPEEYKELQAAILTDIKKFHVITVTMYSCFCSQLGTSMHYKHLPACMCCYTVFSS